MAKEQTDIQVTKEEQNEIIRTYEDDILAGLMKAADFRDDPDEIKEIEIIRNKVLLFRFHIHPLSEEELVDCRKSHTNWKKNKQIGTRVAESIDMPKYRSEIIYRATTEEDRVKIWDNRAAWEKLAVLNGVDMVDAVLKAGEKSNICDVIEDISAYNTDLDQITKN